MSPPRAGRPPGRPKAGHAPSGGSAAAPAASVRALPSDDSIFFKLVRVVNMTARPFSESIGKAHHLSLNEWRVLLVLANHPRVAATEVVGYTGLDKMSVSRALGALARRGRIVRSADAADGRRTLLRLSAEGERLYERIGVPARSREQSLFRGMSDGERQQLGRLLDHLVGNLLVADGG